MDSIKIIPSSLMGKIRIPPSKSLCHRAIIAAGLADEKSNIHNVIYSDDIIATCNGMQDIGAYIDKKNDNITIKGNTLINPIKSRIDCCESGSTLRFLIPLILLTDKSVTFTGKGALIKRPLTPYYKIFDEQNIKYSGSEGLPLTIQGMLSSGEYSVAGNISSQFITGLMFALPLLEGDSKIVLTTELESKSYVDLTIDMLRRFSVKIENNNYKEFFIKGNQKYNSINYKVEGDFSQAAFWIAAGILGDEILCEDLEINSLQGDRVIIDIIQKMGGNIVIQNDKIKASKSKTIGITIDASSCPDLVPIISVIASISKGTTRIINAGRLRYKESDRLKALTLELSKLGADVNEIDDGLIIQGKEKLKGGIVDSWNDHRIAMALSIASIRCTEPVEITNSSAVKKSYPDFYNDFIMLGGHIDEWSMGRQS